MDGWFLYSSTIYCSMASMNIAKRILPVFTKTQSVSWPQSSDPVNGWFRNITSYNGFPVGLVIFLAMAVLCGVVLYNTKPGRYILCLAQQRSSSSFGTNTPENGECFAYVCNLWRYL